MKAAEVECREFLISAQLHMEKLARTEGLEVTSAGPRIRFHLSSNNEMEMIVRIPAPATQKGTVEQSILRRFMNEYLVHVQK